MKKFLIALIVITLIGNFAFPLSVFAGVYQDQGYPKYVTNETSKSVVDGYRKDAGNPTHKDPTPTEFQKYYEIENGKQITGFWNNFFNNTTAGTVLSTTGNVIAAPFTAAASAIKGIYDAANCLTSPMQCVQLIFVSVIQWIGNIILSLVSWLLWLSGIFFNFSIILFVVNMKSVMDKVDVIYTVWRTVRDLANMFFIFILLYIAIQTILNLKYNYKEILRNVILVALFINFSFFATGLMIDASNIVALQFYQGFATSGCTKEATLGPLELADGCISYSIVNALSLKTLYQVTPYTSTTAANLQGVANAALFVALPGVAVLSGVAKLVLAVVMGSILMLIIAIVFLVSGLLLIFRFVELIFLLMFSPLAFAAMILPSTSKYWKEWWERLMTQLIFAPVYFMFLWVVMKVITSKALQTVLTANDASFMSLLDGSNIKGMFGLLANYIIVIALLWYSLALSKKLGASGSKETIKAANSVRGFVGRQTVGRLASRIANSQSVREYTKDSPMLRNIVQTPLNAVAGYDFGGRKGGYTKAYKDHIKDVEEDGKKLGPDPVTVRAAEVKLEAAKSAQDEAKKLAEAPYESQGAKIKEELKAAELKAEKAQIEWSKISSSPLAGSTKGKEVEKELNDSKAEVEAVKKREGDLINTKKAAGDAATSGRLDEEKKAAQKQVDELKGVTKEEATRRATEHVNSIKEANKWTDEQVKVEIKKEADEILKSFKGVAKVRQEAYAKAVEKGYGETFAKLVPGKKAKSVVQYVVDIILTDHHKRNAAAEALRKQIIGKSTKDQLAEAASKLAKENKEEEEEEEKKPPEPKKEEGETGGGSGGGGSSKP
ncbi:TPA: hypothetical protein DCQ44_00055 [Candidatus Taylorbacteria bacterium]|nr:hypothetical protein [Candidatus Taylorbacteria bacterium]